MKATIYACAISLVIGGCSAQEEPVPQMPVDAQPSSNELIFKASDGHLVYADLIPSKPTGSKAVILMFHQAGSNASEYETIAPKIAALGFDCIAVDQRSGGDMWGRVNRTMNKSGTGTYLEAYNDLVGAVAYAGSKQYSTILVWGSSYSSSLVFKLASEYPSVKGVLSFSPGEYMPDKQIVSTWAAKVKVPVFFACTEDEWHDGRSELFDSIHFKDKVSWAIPGGVHGSSTLIAAKSTAAGLYLDKVKSFLQRWEKPSTQTTK